MWSYNITPKGNKALETLEELSDRAKQTLESTKDGDITAQEIQYILGVDYVTTRDVLSILESKGYIRHHE